MKGIEVATSGFHVANGPAANASAVDGALTTATNSLIAAQTFTITDTKAGGIADQTADITATTRDAAEFTNELNKLTGVSASATNSAQFDISGITADISFRLVVGDVAETSKPTTETQVISITYNVDSFEDDFDQAIKDAIAAINVGASDSDLSYDSSTKTITSARGVNIGIDTVVSSSSISFAGSPVVAGNAAVKIGTYSIALDEGFTIATGAVDVVVVATALVEAAMPNTLAGNHIVAQNLTMAGTGSKTVNIEENATAKEIVELVNAVSDTTGVSATALTTATLSNLSADGVVSFKLNNIDISANVVEGDLTALANALNDQSGKTGVFAKLDLTDSVITLTDDTGKDIDILDFNNSSATATTAATFRVTGGDNSGFVTLSTGGGAPVLNADSTVVGGNIEFKSTAISFSVSSSVSGQNGGLFAGNANQLTTSSLENVASLDVSSIENSNRAIDIVDGALQQIDSIRADLGAIQNRMESTISNLAVLNENLSAARSRIQDTDFAAETAELTRTQILQQAGTAMLAQANQLPQNVLSLLQG